MLNFLEATSTTGSNGTAAGGGMGMSMIITLLVMVAVFYFLMIRPEKKRKKEQETLRSSMEEGDKIVTIGGICGTVVDVKEDKFVIETSADRVRIEFAKWALSTNESGMERAKEQAKKAEEARAKAKAEKKNKHNR